MDEILIQIIKKRKKKKMRKRLKPACVKMVLKIRIFFAAFYPEGSFEKNEIFRATHLLV